MVHSSDDVSTSRRFFCEGALSCALAAIWTPTGMAAASGPIARTKYGAVRGLTEGRINVFKGVPYGADTATTRFMLPAPPKPWTGERDAVRYGPRAPQVEGPPREGANLLKSWVIPQQMSEDCLSLNIWTPGLRDGKQRPVMVWIHGGGFISGSGASNGTDGARLAQRGDVVVVTVNHRLNIFGHLYLGALSPEYADSGNAGQHDLVAALRWVRDNIAEFGGDPDNVLLFGESGGGAKICALMAMPSAQGLFHRAVVESGPMVWGVPAERATQSARHALAAMQIAPDKLGALRTSTTERILKAYGQLAAEGATRALAPVVDGRGLPQHPFEPAARVSAKVPLLIGFNRTETTFVLSGADNFNLDWRDLPERLKPHVGDVNLQEVITRYRSILPKASASDLFFEITTQIMMTRNAVLVADRKAAQQAAPVWMYELTWETPVGGGKWRSPHTLEIGLVFDNVARSESLYGPANPAVQRLADLMSESWIAFARSGNPAIGTLPAWPAYDAARRAVMRFDVHSKVAFNPMGPGSEILKDAPYWDMTR
jgi:para-nitrobenzyl esterase